MAFYELKSKIKTLEEKLDLAKEDKKQLIDERETAEQNESKYRKKQERAKEQLETFKKKAMAFQKELLLLKTEHEKLKEQYDQLEEGYANDLESCQIQLNKRNSTIRFLKKELYDRNKSLHTYKHIQSEIEKNKLLLQGFHMQLQERAKTDKLRETLLKTNFQQQVRDALLLGQEQGRQQERQRQRQREADNWKKLLEDEEEFTQTEQEARMSAAHLVASELNGHTSSRLISSTIVPDSKGSSTGAMTASYMNPSNPIFYMDKFNSRMEEANLLLKKNFESSQHIKTTAGNANNNSSLKSVTNCEQQQKNFENVVSRLKNMNRVYFTDQNYQGEKELNIKMKSSDIE